MSNEKKKKKKKAQKDGAVAQHDKWKNGRDCGFAEKAEISNKLPNNRDLRSC